jgi:hypothetical protein
MTTEPEQLDLIIAANRQKLIDFFDQGAPHYRFDMMSGLQIEVHHSTEVPTTCGTTGCIAGAAFTMWLRTISPEERASLVDRATRTADWAPGDNDLVEYDWSMVLGAALDFLGLKRVQGEYCGHPLFNLERAPKATAADAAAALRRTFAGEEPWPGT